MNINGARKWKLQKEEKQQDSSLFKIREISAMFWTHIVNLV